MRNTLLVLLLALTVFAGECSASPWSLTATGVARRADTSKTLRFKKRSVIVKKNAVLDIPRGGDATTPIAQVMKFHRFLAAGLAAFCIFSPGLTAFGASSINLSGPEIDLLRSWGGFVGFVAYCVHVSIPLSTETQILVAKGLAAMFGYEFLLYCIIYGRARAKPNYVDEPAVVSAYMAIFGSLFAAYSIALAKTM